MRKEPYIIGGLNPSRRQFPVVGMWGKETAERLLRTQILVIDIVIYFIVRQRTALRLLSYLQGKWPASTDLGE